MSQSRIVTRMISGATARRALEMQQLRQQNMELVNMQPPAPPQQQQRNPVFDAAGEGETVENEPKTDENLEAGEDSSDEPEVAGGAGPSSRRKRKRYHRHTQHQIREMERFFKDCPHPDDKQRRLLSRDLGLEPLQVKFWFQNKRTQMKMHHERHENTQLRSSNEALRAENMRFKNSFSNSSCPTCGGGNIIGGDMSFDEHNLRLENARLREEVEKIANLVSRNTGRAVCGIQQPRLGEEHGLYNPMAGSVGELCRVFPGQQQQQGVENQLDKQMVFQLAAVAMDELVQMAQMGEPLWIPSSDTNNCFLNEEEYFRMFPRGFGPRPQTLKCEASRFTTIVIMNPMTLVELFLDVNNWKNFFASAVAKASTLEILSNGVAGSYNGALQVMSADFHLLSHFVSVRETFLARYCKHLGEGIWGVVDVSLDNLQPNVMLKCRRRPSGCIIQEMPNGCSKITWVEHVEVEERGTHTIYRPLVNSGLAFGAKRWLAILETQCERMASVLSMVLPPNDPVILSVEAKCSATKLTERMVTTYYGGVSASVSFPWSIVESNGPDDIRVLIQRNMDNPSRPIGVIVSASTSFWLPVPPKRVFDYINNDECRNEWDILSNAATIEVMSNIPAGRENSNSISLLRMNGKMLILQETSWDPVGAYMIYAPVDVLAVNMVGNGGDSDFVALLPSGFVILPDGPSSNGSGAGGSLVTVSFQILVDPSPTAKLSMGSVSTVNNLVSSTMERMKGVFTGQGELLA